MLVKLLKKNIKKSYMSAKSNNYIKSPLNFTGGKFKIIDQILPLFPRRIDKFVDLFCGGLNISINISAKKIIANDINYQIIDFYKILKSQPAKSVLRKINKIIKDNNLSQSAVNGYEKYGCSSNDGLASYNKKKYINLRESYNKSRKKDPILLYVLIIFAFNNQIRFNKKQEFNLPVNKRDFTNNMQRNLIYFSENIRSKNIEFFSNDYHDISISKSDFVYVDPPYLVSTATYNENNGWNLEAEKDLLIYLDNLDKRGIKFALSNVFQNKGKKNSILINWSKKYKIHKISRNYSNAGYNSAKKKAFLTKEVLITNY